MPATGRNPTPGLSHFSLSYRRAFVLRRSVDLRKPGAVAVSFLSSPRRPRRAGDWSPDRAVTFIVTLAATQSVTLAARRAGMSRKSAYGLKRRDPAFASAWLAALKAAAPRARQEPALSLSQGAKADKVDTPSTRPVQGDRLLQRSGSAALADLIAALRDSASLAPRAVGQ